MRRRIHDRVAASYNKEIAAITATRGKVRARLSRLHDIAKAKLQAAVKSQRDKAKNSSRMS